MARVRLQDVAERAGVSIKTVSNVVNDTGRITPETRQRVQEALTALQYRPNAAARHLRRGRSGMVAVALPDLTNPYFAEMSSALVRAAQARQITVLINQTDGRTEAERAIADGIGMPLMDGLVMSPMALSTEDLRHRLDDAPVVLLGEHAGQDPPYPHVGIDNGRAARDATLHLVSTGRRRIAAIGDKEPWSSALPAATAQLRLDGYRQALDEADLPWRPELVAAVPDYDRTVGAAAMRRLLALPQRPDAVFCFNDLLALGALRALHEAGLAVPHDVAVIGIDDIEEGRFSSPTLSTVAPDKQGIAEAALDLVMALGAGTTPEPETVIAHHLTPRESTRRTEGAA